MSREAQSEETTETIDNDLLASLRAEVSAPLTAATDWGTATSIGKVRARNEDANGNLDDVLFVVADGMGGHPGGDLAARTVVSGLLSSATRPIEDWATVLRQVNDQVRIAGKGRGYDKAGSAVVMAAVEAGLVTIAHVGDCRAYRRRGFELQQLTRDHSVREELLAAGIDTAATANRTASLHALTRYMGAADENAMADVSALAPIVGDRLLLCTDGVSRQLDEEQIVHALSGRTCTQSAELLVSMADDAGGRDNATATVVEFGETGAQTARRTTP